MVDNDELEIYTDDDLNYEWATVAKTFVKSRGKDRVLEFAAWCESLEKDGWEIVSTIYDSRQTIGESSTAEFILRRKGEKLKQLEALFG